MPWNLMRRDGEVLVVRERDKKVVGRHRDRKKALRQLRALYSIEKASFGGDRSAAGRYAANIRWQTRVDSDKPSGRTPAQQELLDDFETPQDKVPRSPKNPRGLNPKAIRSWVDGPFPQSAKNFPINDYMRHIANGLLGLPLNTYRKLPTGMPRKGDRIGPSPDWRTTTDQVKNLLESIDNAPPEQPTLWRGMSGRYGRDGGGDQQVETAQRLLATEEGDTLQIPFMSTSRDKGIASLLYGQHLAEQGDPPSVIMRIERGAKGVATSIIPSDHEVITGGKFVVTAKTETTVQYQSGGVTYNRPVILISVKQVDTFGPEDYKDAGFLPSWQHEIRKASFGGDRSAAGRYAAEQRWKGHVVQSDKSDVAGRAETIRTTLSQSAESAKNRITKVFSKENLVRNFGDGVDDAIVDDANKRVKATVEAIDSTVREVNKLLDSMVAGEGRAVFRVPDAVKKEIAKLGALERKLYKQIHTIDPTSFVNPSNPFDTGLPQRKGDSVQRPNPTTPSGKVAAAQWLVVHSLSVELKTVVHQVDALSQKLILEKASFGGDRSAAGRYAAEQRWKGHVKAEPAGSPPSGGAGDFMRLINGTPQTYTVKGVIKVHGFGIEGGISRGHYDDLVKADPNEEGNSSGVLQTTAGEFRRMATSGQLDLSPKWVDHVVRSLEEHSDDTRVAVELGVDAIIVRNQPIVPIRPDQPHTAKDIVSIGQSINHSAQLDEDWGLQNETDKKLTVNTSPRNRGPVKSGTLSRWEKAWENDYYNMPYCKEIASHAAYLMGQIDAPVERWGRREGFRAPSEAMLAQDAKDLLASINQGVEGQPVLWRGLEPSRSATKGLVDKAKAGDTLTLGLASTSRDALAAAKYTQAYSGESKPIIMRIEEGSKGVSLGDRALYRHDQEVITSGKFEVVDVQTVTVPKWQFPRLGVETIQPSERIAIAREALPKVKALLPPQQYAAIERSVEREAQKRLEFEKETVTVKIVSVRQTETFNPETEEFEANG